jgi:predicted nucleotidyltransferase
LGTRKQNQSVTITPRPIDVLFPSTLQRVLALFFCHPDESYHLTQIIDRVRAGRGVVQRTLTRLVASELVVAREQGRHRFFTANRETPLFAPLQELLVRTVGLVDPVRDALRTLRVRIRFAAIYGSTARHTDRSSSDVDLLVVSDDLTLEELYEALESAEQAIGRKVSPTLYTSAEFTRRRREANPFLTKLLAGDLIPLIGEPDAASQPR